MKFFRIVPDGTQIDFIGKLNFFLLVSGIMVALTIYQIVVRGFNYGIDFTGGTMFQVKFNSPRSAEEVRALLRGVGGGDATVVASGQTRTEYMITSRAEISQTTDPLHKRFIAKVGVDQCQLQQVDFVGPKVGKELRTSAVLSLVYSVLLIMVYIWFRFDAKFAPGATIAMMHDITLAAGFYMLTGREFTITAVAALLTIAGYSVNDTIVIYDRVRELLKQGNEGMPLAQTLNRAINLTLSRTLLTGLITLISVIPIAVFCTGEIQSFAIAMIFGIFVGAYSTIYIAAPFTLIAAKWVKPETRRTATA